MQFRTWKTGLAGLIFIPSRSSNAEDKNRPYYVADVDAKGKLRVREGPMIWHEARTRILQLASGEGKIAFRSPEGGRLQNFRVHGYLHLSPEERALEKKEEPPKVKKAAPLKAVPGRTVSPSVQYSGLGTLKETPSAEAFDVLFDKWADEALRVAGFPAEKPKQGESYPNYCKKKGCPIMRDGNLFLGFQARVLSDG